MGIIASCCAAAACSCCVGISCSFCGLLVTISRSVATRIWYSSFFIILSFVAYFFSIISFYIVPHLPDWLPIFGEDCTSYQNCAVFTIYRITFGLFLYHLILSIILIGVKNTKDVRAQLNNGWWALKIPLLFIFIIGDFFIPGEFFTIYAWASVFGAGAFIVIQLLLLIDLAYSWSESWVAKWDYNIVDGSQNKKWYYALLGCSLFFFLVAAVMNVMLYILFCQDGKCWYNPLMITANIVVCIILVVLSVHPKIREFNDRIGLLQASIFTVYCTYYVYSAILSEPNSCSDLPFDFFSDPYSDSSAVTDSLVDWVTLIFGAIFTVASVVYASLSVGSSSNFIGYRDENAKDDVESLINTDGLDEDDIPLEEIPTKHEEEDEDEEDHDDEKDQNSYNYSLFHLAFALGAMYVGMLLTNWSVVSSDISIPTQSYEVVQGETDSGWVAVFIKLLTVLAAFGLYSWSIFAPCILPNRHWE